jgi:hypothetical protein
MQLLSTIETPKPRLNVCTASLETVENSPDIIFQSRPRLVKKLGLDVTRNLDFNLDCSQLSRPPTLVLRLSLLVLTLLRIALT